MGPDGSSGTGLILARATVNLQRLAVGETVTVDLDHPFVAELLEATFLVPVGVVEPEA